MLKLYGIPNCDTVKKARVWLAGHAIAFEFHDFKKQGLSPELAQGWLQQASWEQLINRKGLIWRGLSDAQKMAITGNAEAQQLMLDKTSVIKRPLLEQDGKLLHIGFDEAAYGKLFNL
jgi:Spx/MgsR family transcriptional regulator